MYNELDLLRKYFQKINDKLLRSHNSKSGIKMLLYEDDLELVLLLINNECRKGEYIGCGPTGCSE